MDANGILGIIHAALVSERGKRVMVYLSELGGEAQLEEGDGLEERLLRTWHQLQQNPAHAAAFGRIVLDLFRTLCDPNANGLTERDLPVAAYLRASELFDEDLAMPRAGKEDPSREQAPASSPKAPAAVVPPPRGNKPRSAQFTI